MSRTHDMHRLGLLIGAFARSFFLKKRLIPRNVCSAKALDQNTHPRMSAHHEDPSKTANRTWKEQQGKCLRQFFLKNVVGHLVLPRVAIV